MSVVTSTGPLSGVRVVEFVGIGPGPFAAMMLADLGAEVVRIDRPAGAALQVAPPDRDILGRGRRNVALDLKTDAGRVTALRLIERADILVEGFRPGVMERLGLGPEAAFAVNRALVFGRMTGWGQHGPLAHTAGHDINYISVAGGLHPIGRAGGPPQVPLNLLGDFAGGSLYLVSGVLAALLHARSSGQGQVVDAAITDGVAHLLAMPLSMQQSGGWNGQRGTNLLDTGAPFYDVYQTSDGEWMSVGGLEPQFWFAMQQVLIELGYGELPDRNDANQWPALRTRLAEIFVDRPQTEWAELFAHTDACVAPVVPMAEAAQHPHLVARGSYVEVEGITQPAPAPKFSATPAELTTGPAIPGAHTRETLLDWGIENADELIASGAAVHTGPAVVTEPTSEEND